MVGGDINILLSNGFSAKKMYCMETEKFVATTKWVVTHE